MTNWPIRYVTLQIFSDSISKFNGKSYDAVPPSCFASEKLYYSDWHYDGPCTNGLGLFGWSIAGTRKWGWYSYYLRRPQQYLISMSIHWEWINFSRTYLKKHLFSGWCQENKSFYWVCLWNKTFPYLAYEEQIQYNNFRSRAALENTEIGSLKRDIITRFSNSRKRTTLRN